MLRLITILTLLLGVCSVPSSAFGDEKKDRKVLQFDPGENNSDRPRKPAFCPFSGYADESCIALFSSSSQEIEIIIVDKAGAPVYYESTEICGEYIIPLEQGINYHTVYIIAGDITFHALL